MRALLLPPECGQRRRPVSGARVGIQQAINRDPEGLTACRYARSPRFARNGDEAARKAIWCDLPTAVRIVDRPMGFRR